MNAINHKLSCQSDTLPLISMESWTQLFVRSLKST